MSLFRQQQALRDGPNVQDAIAQIKALILWTNGVINDQNKNYGTAVSELHQAYKSRPELFDEGNYNYIAAVEMRYRESGQMPVQNLTLQRSDTMIVDGRIVPSGLSKSVEDAIASVYADAPPGVSDRVRKGFQAVMTRDWKVARAWFQDALNRDPDNVNLKSYVALVSHGIKDYGERGEKLQSKQESALVSLNARASSLSKEQIMRALDAFMLESHCNLCPASRYP